ncbi:hypothetical protein E3O11_08545 [Cryobacterium levicorallinum]|uniref:Uncharacterized protein n=1 Tax=Cryobacterium levicorallinum TaxID=995038 RepID=A0A4R8VQE7_9MICO|nr:hypothetical protein E3O11_08545 [Cryobacterium levicorallinum]
MDELAAMGVAAPPRVPMLYAMATNPFQFGKSCLPRPSRLWWS